MWKRPNSNSRPITREEAQYKAAAYCSTAEHCPQEVRDKLLAWGASPEQIEQVLDYLTDENFISEERFCRAFVNDKIRFQKWGKEKVRQALALKRLPTLLVQEALEAFPDEDYMDVLNDLAAKKRHELRGEEPEVGRAKLCRFLMGRGFSYRDIERISNDD